MNDNVDPLPQAGNLKDRCPLGSRTLGSRTLGSRTRGSSRTLALTVCSAAIGGTFQYGYNLSIINAPTNYIQTFINETYQQRWGAGLDGPQVTGIWSLIVSAFSLGGLAGALLAGPMAVHCGRKQSLLVNNTFMFISALLVVTSRAARSFEMIVVARFLVGVNCGVSMNIQPMYFGESAPKHLRGAVTFSSAVFTAFGIFMGQVIGLTELLGSEPMWPYLLASNALPGVLQLLTLPWFPESPRYLLIDRGDHQACALALGRLRGGLAPVGEMEEILEEQKALVASAGCSSAKTMWDLFSDRALRPQLRVVMVASSAMMLCGNDAIYFYASSIFLQAGVPSDQVQYACLGTGACELTAAVVCNLLIEKVGRRRLLIGGYGLMVCWSLVFTLALSLEGTVPGMPYLSVLCVFSYILSFGMGPAGVTGVLPAEIFDQAARPAAYMVTGSLMWISLFLVGMLFPFVVRGLVNFCFLPFCCVCIAASSFLGMTLPETRGRSLAEITSQFDRLRLKNQRGAEGQGGDPREEPYRQGQRGGEGQGGDPREEPYRQGQRGGEGQGGDPREEPYRQGQRGAEGQGGDPREEPYRQGQRGAEGQGGDPREELNRQGQRGAEGQGGDPREEPYRQGQPYPHSPPQLQLFSESGASEGCPAATGAAV